MRRFAGWVIVDSLCTGHAIKSAWGVAPIDELTLEDVAVGGGRVEVGKIARGESDQVEFS